MGSEVEVKPIWIRADAMMLMNLPSSVYDTGFGEERVKLGESDSCEWLLTVKNVKTYYFQIFSSS